MTTVWIIVWIARLAGIVALVLGLFFWITSIDVVNVHMIFGLMLALSLLILGIIMLCSRGARLLGVAGIGYAFLLPIFGLAQASLLMEHMHWLIQIAHLFVGIGAGALVQGISVRYRRLKLTTTSETPSSQAIRQAWRKKHV
ncbi:hypothetical protein [Ktedonosporobacter rubrisoli]|uniref:hypothetical protein n=1 Tax=Ktedonosporobacter rubrisoli TaxID=2509675 RepID=UPI001A930011|nr:hypothetical protein [Ktedonosporobacter rubrisoli]